MQTLSIRINSQVALEHFDKGVAIRRCVAITLHKVDDC